MIKIYKDGDRFGLITNAETEDGFLDEISSEIAKRIEFATDYDWKFHLGYLLPLIIDMCCYYRAKTPNRPVNKLLATGVIPYKDWNKS